MTRRRPILLLAAAPAAAALAVAALPGPAAAASPPSVTYAGLRVTQLRVPRQVDTDVLRSVLARARGTGTSRVIVQLDRQPLAGALRVAADRGVTLTGAQRSAVVSGVRAQQADLVREVRAAGGRIESRVQYAYNGLEVTATSAALRRIAALPGVSSITAVHTYRPSLATSVPYLGVPQVWQGLGLTGTGVKVGIMDTGIDYTHADFGGPGTRAAYASNDRSVVEPGTFPTAKVAGGYDFVGDAYDAASKDPAKTSPKPDADPLDCDGHGTHVAGIAAGEGVRPDGRTFSGPYGPGAYRGGFRVAPGVAPQATLYALKVFGCSGSVATGPLLQAIDWAVAHHLDVLNMSLGSAFSLPTDPEAQALDNAAAAGVLPVVAAGNDGPGRYVVSSPSTARSAISVAAVDPHSTLPAAALTAGGTTLTLQNSNQAAVPSVRARVVVLTDNPATAPDESLGCDAADYAGTAGAIVVTQRGICPRVARAPLAQAAGAVAVVMINSSATFPPVEGPIPGVTIPFLGATPALGAQLVRLAGQTVTLHPAAPIANPGYTRTADFSSSGPSLRDTGAKPDVAAPGVSIVSAAMGTGSGPLTESGTSQATPHVTGVAALVREAHPTASATVVHDAIVNTADPSRIGGYDQLLDGAGLVDPAAAIATGVTAAAGRGTSASFGYLESTRAVTAHETIRIRNRGRTLQTYALAVSRGSVPPQGGDVAVSPSRVTVPARGDLKVTLSVSVPAGVTSAPGILAGAVVLRPASAGPVLRVPFLAAVRTASDIVARPHSLRVTPAEQRLRLTNRSVTEGSTDTFAWGEHDTGPDVGRLDAPDLRDVGVAADTSLVPPGGGQGLGLFAVALSTRLTSAVGYEQDVLVDVDGDGTADYDVLSVDAGALLTGSVTGELGVFTVDLHTGTIVRGFTVSPEEDTSVVELPFVPSDLGLTASGRSAFAYRAVAYSLDGAGLDTAEAPGVFDPFHPAVSNGIHADLPGGASGTLPVRVDPAAQARTPALGFLLVHNGNRTGGKQSDTVRLRTG